MGIYVSKYEFNSQEQAETKINALPSDDDGNPTHKHTIVKLGNIVVTEGQYDENGEETVAPVLSDSYHVDVLWKDIMLPMICFLNRAQKFLPSMSFVRS